MHNILVLENIASADAQDFRIILLKLAIVCRFALQQLTRQSSGINASPHIS